MAIVQNPLIGKSKQSLANATFTTWKGINVVKSKAISVSNPQTQKQTNQRNRFTAAVEMDRSVLTLVRKSFKEVAKGMSEYNAWMHNNLAAFSIDSTGNVVIAADKLIFSKGTLLNVAAPTVTGGLNPGANASVALNWTDNSNGTDALPTDKVYTVAIDTEHTHAYVSDNFYKRSEKTGDFTFSTYSSGTINYVYVVVLRENTGQAADSIKIG